MNRKCDSVEYPLAMAYVPFQEWEEIYDAKRALERGTAFASLDLPFCVRDCPVRCRATNAREDKLRKVQQYSFIVDEMQLFLDTHPKSSEAFYTLKKFIALEKAATNEYEALYGPLTIESVGKCGAYDWADGIWPWKTGE